MKNDIWKKAPVGATHLCEKPVEWYKLSPEGWLVWYAKAERWHTSFIKERTNELVARPTAPQWNGTGLPPVGVACNMHISDGRGKAVEILGHGRTHAFIREVHNGEEWSPRLENVSFSVIRTPEQIAAEEREVAVKDMVNRFALYSHPDIQWRALFEHMYDCGCRITAEDER